MSHALTHRVPILCLLLFATSAQAVTTIQNQRNQNANPSGGTNWVPTGKGLGVQVAPGKAPPLVAVPNAAAAGNGKNGMAVACAAMRKMVHAFAILKSGKPFDPEFKLAKGAA